MRLLKVVIGNSSLVPCRLSWNANIFPRLHNFNVCVPKRGSLGMRLRQ